jgi:hypothetical protein
VGSCLGTIPSPPWGWVKTPSGVSGTRIPLRNTGEMLLLQAPFTGGPGGHALHAGTSRRHPPMGCVPWTTAPSVAAARHRSPPDLDTLENSVCSTHPARHGWMLIHGMSQHRPSEAQCLCWPWGPPRAMWCMVLDWTEGGRAGSPTRVSPTKVSANHVLTGDDGTNQGERYWTARGEILRPFPDPLERWRSAGLGSSIKDESLGNEDDQTPS